MIELKGILQIATFTMAMVAALMGDSSNIKVPLSAMVIAIFLGIMSLVIEYFTRGTNEKRNRNRRKNYRFTM